MSFMAENLWSLAYDIQAGGLVLNDVKHDGFSLARDFRVTRIWITDEHDTRTRKSFVLGDAAMPAQGGVQRLGGPGTAASAPAPLDIYRTMFGLGASFKSASPYLAGSPNACDIAVTQRYLFGDYGKNPPHEPGAVLNATRLFPLLDFRLPPVADPDKPHPSHFRADFRIDVALDNIRELLLAAHGFRPGPAQDRVMNKAAIFRDNEGLNIGWPDIKNIFAALEKPLKYEVCTWGMLESGRQSQTPKEQAWDNLHLWAAVRGDKANPISTPGAFHAFHCHWRWGAVSGTPTHWYSPSRRLLPSAGQAQFKGLGWTEAAGGPLIDPRIPKQDMRFAITRNDAEWAAEKNPSGEDFLWMFEEKRLPDVVEQGDDLVLWFSFDVYRDPARLREPWEGTLFINGLYFAHNIDLTPLAVQRGGGYDSGANPFPRRRWYRPAKY